MQASFSRSLSRGERLWKYQTDSFISLTLCNVNDYAISSGMRSKYFVETRRHFAVSSGITTEIAFNSIMFLKKTLHLKMSIVGNIVITIIRKLMIISSLKR